MTYAMERPLLPGIIHLDPCPDSVWELLPGGREARNGEETWQYLRTYEWPEHFTHSFSHDRHPLYSDHFVWADVQDGDAGPRLAGALIWYGGWDAELVEFDEHGNEIARR